MANSQPNFGTIHKRDPQIGTKRSLNNYPNTLIKSDLKKTDDILEILEKYNVGNLIQKKIDLEALKAIAALKKIKESMYKESLIELANFCTERDN